MRTEATSMWLLLRSVAFAVLLPGTVTLVLPTAILSARPATPAGIGQPSSWLAVAVIAAGAWLWRRRGSTAAARRASARTWNQ
jgi:hypothetical protein